MITKTVLLIITVLLFFGCTNCAEMRIEYIGDPLLQVCNGTEMYINLLYVDDTLWGDLQTNDCRYKLFEPGEYKIVAYADSFGLEWIYYATITNGGLIVTLE